MQDEALQSAKSSDWAQRAASAQLLVGAGTVESEAALAELLSDADTAVVIAAAEALVGRADHQAARLFLAALSNPDVEVGEHILWVLYVALHIGTAPVPDLCRACLAESEPEVVRAGAAEALGWLGIEEARDELAALASAAHGHVAERARDAVVALARRRLLGDG